jgi:hypothetical protein
MPASNNPFKSLLHPAAGGLVRSSLCRGRTGSDHARRRKWCRRFEPWEAKRPAVLAPLRQGAHLLFLLFRFNVPGEIVENGLPPSLLLLDGMRRFAVKGDADADAFGARGELDLRLILC